MKKDYQCNSINHEMFKIKKAYCKKCIYFDDDNFKCTQNKIYKKCLKNDERIIDERCPKIFEVYSKLDIL